MSLFKTIASINKCNNQINIAVPKRKIGKRLLKHLLERKPVKIRMEQ